MPTTTEGSTGLLADTNILVRLVNKADREHILVAEALGSLKKRQIQIFYSPQNLREFWNVATRPAARNGLGYSISETNNLAIRIEKVFTLLQDTDAMHREWRRLVVQHEVRGTHVHDARLAAVALATGCRAILTLNDTDFKRFGIPALHPLSVED